MAFRANPTALGWRLLLMVLLGLTPLGLAACAADSANPALGCEAATTPCLQGTAVVAMDTSKGPVELRLDGAAAPLTENSRFQRVGGAWRYVTGVPLAVTPA